MVLVLPGPTLDIVRHDFVPRRVFSRSTAAFLVLETLAAVTELHALGFVHRDVKPHNFVIAGQTAALARSVLFLDLGVARSFEGDKAK